MKCVFLHGLGQTAQSWHFVTKHLNKEFDAYCWDLKQESAEQPVSYQGLYHTVQEKCQTISEPFVLCGLSLGAVLALQYVMEHPETISHLVLIAAQYKMPKTLLKLQNIVFRFLPNRFFAETGFEKEELIQLTCSMMELDFEATLTQIQCPVLVVCGEKDAANKKAAKQLEQKLPKAKLIWIKDAGHEVNLSHPQELAKAISDFCCKQKIK